MNHKNFTSLCKIGILLILAAFLLLGAGVYAQSSSSYDLSWWTLDGGGGTLSGAGYTLNGTIGQPDAGTLQDGTYTLTGGFWGG
ncbi:MAG: hypothetical protein GY832_09150, partial [Chloroflexi bacterium]|nr:hypothetical protein [Chloroflexota bacterium]